MVRTRLIQISLFLLLAIAVTTPASAAAPAPSPATSAQPTTPTPAPYRITSAPTSRPVCQPNGGECAYTVVNRFAEDVAREVEDSVFHGKLDDAGTIKASSDGGEIRFWHPNPEILEAEKAAMEIFDRLGNFNTLPSVFINVQCYLVDSNFFRGFGFSLSGVDHPANPAAFDRARFGPGSDGTTFDFHALVGNAISNISIALEAGRGTTVRELSEGLGAPYMNGQNISLNKTEKRYLISSTFGTPVSETAGLMVSGIVNMNGSDSDVVRIKNPSVTFGVPSDEPNAIVKTHAYQAGYVDIVVGQPLAIVSGEITLKEDKKNRAILNFGNSNKNGSARLVILISVQPIAPHRPLNYSPSAVEVNVLPK